MGGRGSTSPKQAPPKKGGQLNRDTIMRMNRDELKFYGEKISVVLNKNISPKEAKRRFNLLSQGQSYAGLRRYVLDHYKSISSEITQKSKNGTAKKLLTTLGKKRIDKMSRFKLEILARTHFEESNKSIMSPKEAKEISEILFKDVPKNKLLEYIHAEMK